MGIGGMGGSGTRVVARILMETGIYLGDDLNDECDNLVFCRLFKDPEWYRAAGQMDIERRFRIFSDYMSGNRWSLSQAIGYFRSTRTKIVRDGRDFHHFLVAARKVFIPGRARKRWGWKEPNTQVVLDRISRCDRGFRYVHVIRHGLEMAFSGNNQQLLNWGPLYGVYVTNKNDRTEITKKQLDYWIRVNKLVLETCREKMRGRHLVVNFNRLCANPLDEIRRLFTVTGIEWDEQLIARLAMIPKTPASTGRYLTEDLSGLTRQQMEAVRDLGFEVELISPFDRGDALQLSTLGTMYKTG